VNQQIRGLTLVAITTMLCGGLARAADEAESDVTLATDLTAVIALQAMPCGQVLSTMEQGENDYLATCQDGSRYRVFVNADGRVIVTKQ
jgi:hypothetical protein